MKDRKGCLGEALAEIVVELVLTGVMFGIGALVFKLFGLDIDAEHLDGDLTVLVGIGALAALALIFALVWYIARSIKRNSKNKAEGKPSEENQEENKNI